MLPERCGKAHSTCPKPPITTCLVPSLCSVLEAAGSLESCSMPFTYLTGPCSVSILQAFHNIWPCIPLCSVLEPSRTLTLAERGGEGAEVITAAPNFLLVATMNPGGDFGKKELSPALTNRFTVVWVPALEDREELLAILQARLHGECFEGYVGCRRDTLWHAWSRGR